MDQPVAWDLGGAQLAAVGDGDVADAVCGLPRDLDADGDSWGACGESAAGERAAAAARRAARAECLAIAEAVAEEFGPLTGTGARVVAARIRSL